MTTIFVRRNAMSEGDDWERGSNAMWSRGVFQSRETTTEGEKTCKLVVTKTSDMHAFAEAVEIG